jgi:hypothetical protein
MAATEGSPAFTSVDPGACWGLDDASTERVDCSFLLPADWRLGSLVVKFYITNLTADAGDVEWAARYDLVADGDTPSASQSTLTSTAPAQNVVDVITVATITGAVKGNLLFLSAGRLGGDGDDDKAGDAGLFGVEVEYTADF